MSQETTSEKKPIEDKPYRIMEFCEKYSISRATFYREVAANRLIAFKRGRRTLIAHRDAEAWHENERKNRLHPVIAECTTSPLSPGNAS